MLSAWDTALFRAIHLGWHHAWLDPVMMAFTDPGRWKLPILIAAGACFLARGLRGSVGLVALAFTIAASDQLSSHILKPLFRRPRPSVTLADARPLFGKRHSYSFPSSHATNFTAAIPIVATVFPAAGGPYVVVTSLVCLSRVYVGDHYPADVLGGAILGLSLGWLGRMAFLRAMATIDRRRRGALATPDTPVSAIPDGRGGGGPSAFP